MKLENFINKNDRYKIKVIAPTRTYGTMYNLDSKYNFDIDFDEYDTTTDWEFNIEVDEQIIATFNSVEDVKKF